jgi:hypothetical protein
VTERDGAAIHVHDVGRDAKRAHGRDADRGERLVDLEEVQVTDSQAGLAECLADRVRRLEVQAVVRTRDGAERADLGEDVGVELGGFGPAGHDEGGGAVRDLRGRARGDRAFLTEGRPELRQGLRGRVGTDALVAGEGDRVPPGLDLDGDDLLGEQAVLRGLGGALL